MNPRIGRDKCRIKGCTGLVAVVKHGLCHAHYARLRFGLPLEPPINRKRAVKERHA